MTKPSRIAGNDTLRDVKCEAGPPEHRVQVIVGRLLWIARCMRPDIAQMVSALGSRVATWDHHCDTQLALLMGYLKLTAHFELKFCWRKTTSPSAARFRLHSDSDWLSPKSQSSLFAFVGASKTPDPKEAFPEETGWDEDCVLPIHWTSRKQPICTQSSTSAEIVAANFSLLNGFPILDSFRTALSSSCDVWHSDIVIELDNTGAILNITKSPSDSAHFQEKAIGCRHGLLRDLYNLSLFKCEKVGTHFNKADVGTKCFSKDEAQTKANLVCLTNTEVLLCTAKETKEAIDAKKTNRAFRGQMWRKYNDDVALKAYQSRRAFFAQVGRL